MAAAPPAAGGKLTHSFTKEQVAEYKEQFDAFDEDSSGTIEGSELKTVLEKCGQEVTDAQVKDLITEYDTDKSGTLDFEEFLLMMWRLQSGPSEKEIRNEMFQMFDDNMDGFISLEELRAFFRKAFEDSKGMIEVPADAMLRQMILEADTDGDGKLNFEEFISVVEQCA